MSGRAGPGRRDRPRPAPVRLETGVGEVELVADPRRPGGRVLMIDGQLHGAVDLDDPAWLGLDYQVRLVAVLEVLLPAGAAGEVVHLGGGAFGIPRALAAARPGLRHTVVERSGAVIALAERELGVRASGSLRIRRGDARSHLRRLPDGSVAAVVGDAFVGGRTPPHLATVEFAELLGRVLQPGGAYVLNLIDQPPYPVLARHAATLREVFGELAVVLARGAARRHRPDNVLLLAADTPLPTAELASRLAGGTHPSELLSATRLDALAASAAPLHDPTPDPRAACDAAG